MKPKPTKTVDTQRVPRRLHDAAVAYADSRTPLWRAFLQGDQRAAQKLLFDDIAAHLPPSHARIIGLDKL